MDFGQFLSDAGRGMTAASKLAEAARIERQNQLAIENMNRTADLDKKEAGMKPVFLNSILTPQFNNVDGPLPPAMPYEQMPAQMPAAAPAAPAQQVSAAAEPVRSLAAVAAANKAKPPAKPVFQSNAETPAGRWLEGVGSTFDEYNKLQALRFKVNDKYRLDAGLLGMFRSQTDEQRKTAKEIMSRLGDMSADELEYVLANNKLPPAPVVEPKKQPAPQAKKPAEDPAVTSAAAQYDNARTPYDDLITRSAQQYGLDPVMFKRLIGTESSFNPAAVSPKGEGAGLGIAQISRHHNLTREQKLDPNTAIPYAAKLFSQYLAEANGDQVRALEKYKGAVSEQGKASMAGPIGLILSGTRPQQQQVVTPPATLETPATQTRNMQMADYYLANPNAIPFEMEQVNKFAQQQAELLTRQRNQAAQMAQLYISSNTAKGREMGAQLIATVNQLDGSLLSLQQQVEQKQMYLQGMQGVRELSTANDPRRLSGVLSRYLGVPVGIQPRSDGMYNYFVNGRKVVDGVTPQALAQKALLEFNPEARTAAASSAALENKLALEQRYSSDTATALAGIQKAIVEGEYKLAERRAQDSNGKLTVDTSKGVAYFQQGNSVFIINPDGTIQETKSGPVNTGPVAKQVMGINLGM
jgi:hypothetical protein